MRKYRVVITKSGKPETYHFATSRAARGFMTMSYDGLDAAEAATTAMSLDVVNVPRRGMWLIHLENVHKAFASTTARSTYQRHGTLEEVTTWGKQFETIGVRLVRIEEMK